MTVKIIMKKVRNEKGISLRQLEEDTGIEREYLADIENEVIPADEILFMEMLVIANAMACSILDLYETGHLEIKGFGVI